MFILQENPTWLWPVTARVPNDQGTVTSHSFRARFRLVPMERFAQLGVTSQGTDEALREAVVELLDIVDPARQPIPHSAALMDAVMANPWLRAGLLDAYIGAIAGVAPAPAAAGN